MTRAATHVLCVAFAAAVVAGCSGSHGGDAASGTDAGNDATTDGSRVADTGSDATDTGSDATADASADASSDVTTDVTTDVNTDASTGEGGTLDGAAVDAAADTGSTSKDSGPADTGTGATDAGATTVIRVHYPAGTHAVTIRGSAGGLSWAKGQSTTPSGDTFSYQLANLSATAEYKPLLDDMTWARGPNYHVSPGQTVDIWPHFTTTKGQVVTLIATFHSTVLGNDRAIYAYLPASYQENTDATYPVVYMHDGQNLWAALPQLAVAGTWNVDTAFDTASESGACSSGGVVGWGAVPLDGGTPAICAGDGDCASNDCRTFPEAIVVGVANDSNRIYEYTPTTDPTTPGGGGADLYLKMLVQELKPAVDGMLRTRTDVASTAMVGSALGGLVTAYAGLKYPSVYGMVGEMSPSSWWNSDVIVTDVQGTPPAPARPLVVYVDSGQGSVDDETDTDMLASAYLALGYTDGTNFRHVVQPGATHTEAYWAERFPGAMQIMLGVR
jgi:predicted alpha/beta superfamily hydrolase